MISFKEVRSEATEVPGSYAPEQPTDDILMHSFRSHRTLWTFAIQYKPEYISLKTSHDRLNLIIPTVKQGPFPQHKDLDPLMFRRDVHLSPATIFESSPPNNHAAPSGTSATNHPGLRSYNHGAEHAQPLLRTSLLPSRIACQSGNGIDISGYSDTSTLRNTKARREARMRLAQRSSLLVAG